MDNKPATAPGELSEQGSSDLTTNSADQEQTLGLTDEELLRAELLKTIQEKDEAETRAEKYYRRLLRMEADFEGSRRRFRQEKEELIQRATEKVVGRMLPVLDDLERALQAAQTSRDLNSLVSGMELVHREFYKILENEGLRPVSALGSEFDPHLHEAIAQSVEEDPDLDNRVVQELQKGYLYHDRLLRAARVVVARSREQ